MQILEVALHDLLPDRQSNYTESRIPCPHSAV